MHIPYFETQVDLLHKIASMRTDWLDPFFLFLNYFDSLYFPLFLIPVVWVGISPKWGLRVALLNIASTLINDCLKYFLDLPRPIADFPDLAMITFQSPGFPSGGAQTAALMGGFLIYAWKSRWAWVIAIPYMLLVSFSRLYLGVHYPMDVVGGFAIGLAILFIYIKTIRHIEKFCQTKGRGFCLISCMLIGALYLFLVPNLYFGHQLMGAFMGVTLGYYITIRFHNHPTLPPVVWKRTLSVALTVLVAFGLFLALPKITPLPVQAFIIAMWISALAIPFSRFVTVKN
jgi:membrane-associated phospholipid phosphatase